MLSNVVGSHDSSSSPFILTDGRSRPAPPPESVQEWTPVHKSPAPERWEAAHAIRSFPYKLTKEEKKKRPWAERDWVLGMLREVVGLRGVKWESLGDRGYWRWLAALKREIQEVDGIADSDFKERERPFFGCGSWRSGGGQVEYIDGSKRLYAYSCSEAACLRCKDRAARRTAIKLAKKILAASATQGIRRFWGIVITVPMEYEGMLVEGSVLRQKVIEAVQKYLRKLFGLKTRDGLFSYCAVHPVGDEDLFRDRFHFHCGVLPMAIRKSESLIKCDFKTFKADLERARSLLADHLEAVLPDYQRELTQVNLKPFLLKRTAKNIAKLMHRLKYDLRGFGKDVEQAPVCFNLERKLVVVKQGEHGYGTFTFRQVAERWKWIRQQRGRLRVWGVLHQWSKYLELLGLEFAPDPEPEIVNDEEITVIRSGGRQWNPEKKRVEWVNKKTAIDKDGQVIFGVEWGRKGSDGDWRPLTRSTAPKPSKPDLIKKTKQSQLALLDGG